ncbi:Protein angel-like protein, partial [Stegodyphus mimosarum]
MARQGAVSVEEMIRRKVANSRHWKFTKLGKKQRRWGFDFTIMTYNILSQNAVENHRYLYKYCNPSFLDEEYRISKIMPEILKSQSDVICLQEVEEALYDKRIKKVFDSNGFESLFKRRTGSKSDGCAILWRRSKFNLLRHRDVEFRAKECKFLDRDNIGLIAVLKPIHPASKKKVQLHIATTHLLFNPRRGDIKLCQLRLFLAELEKMALRQVTEQGRLYHPVILCGDFNFEPRSPLYQFVENGCLNLTDMKSGDMSGQAEGKNKGQFVRSESLSLHELGISETGRFETIVLPEGDDCNSLAKPKETKLSSSGATASGSGKKNSNNTPSYIKDLGRNAVTVSPEWLEAVGAYKDPRWLSALGALGNAHLVNQIASQIQQAHKSSNNHSRHSSPMSLDSNKSSGSSRQASREGTPQRSLPPADAPNSEDLGHIVRHGFNFVPAYKYREEQKSIPVTSMTGNDFSTVDHIFYHVKEKQGPRNFTEDRLKLLGFYSLMQSEELDELGGLPNAYLGSDHVCLMAKFVINYK